MPSFKLPRKYVIERRRKYVAGLRVKAFLGRSDGVIDGDQPDFVWATDTNGESIQVFNDVIPTKRFGYGLPIWLERSENSPFWRVSAVRQIWPSGPVAVGAKEHNDTHTALGNDPVWVWADQFMPWLCAPQGLTLKIYRMGYWDGDTWIDASVETLDLASHKPTSGARYVLVEVAQDGTLQVTDGSIVSARENLQVTDVPAPTEGCFALCAVRMYAGQTQIMKNKYNKDVFDLRFARGIGGGGGGAGDMTKAMYDPQNIADDAFDLGNHTGVVAARKIEPLKISPTTGLTVGMADTPIYWNWFFGETNSHFTHLASLTKDLTSSVPVSGARYVLIYLLTPPDDNPYLDTKNGTPGVSKAALTWDDIPGFGAANSAGTYPLAAVALEAGQTSIAESDIVDLRFSGLDAGGMLTRLVYNSSEGNKIVLWNGNNQLGLSARTTMDFALSARTLTGSAPITVDGDNAAHDLSANRTLAITAATTGAAGSMSAADKTKLDGLPSSAPAKVSPSVADDIVTFNDTTGGQKDSGVKLSALLHADGSVSADFLRFLTSPTHGSTAAGDLWWNGADGTLNLQSDIANSTLQIGQEMWVRVVNKTGADVADGVAVYLSGAQGQRPKIELADADFEATSYVLGLTTSPISKNAEGFVTISGLVRDINTAAFLDGDLLWLSQTAGEVTKTKPTPPAHAVAVGLCVYAHAAHGIIYVNPMIGYELDELHNVLISSATDKDILQYIASAGLWENKSLSAAGIAKLAHDHSSDAESGTTLQVNKDVYKFGFVTDYAGAQQTTIAFDGTNVFTLAPTGTTWSYYRNGLKHTITGSKTVTLSGSPPAAKGLYYIYIDATDGTLTASTGGWTLEDTKVPVAIVAWDNSLTPKYWLADERHDASYGRRNHWEHHFSDGTEMISGPVLSGPNVAPSTPADTDNVFGITNTPTLADEDIKHVLDALTKPNGTATAYTVMYRTAAAVWVWAASAMPYPYSGTYIQYDNGGTLTTGQNNKWYNSYLLLTNLGASASARYVLIPGQAEFGTLAAAQAESFATLVKTGLPAVEYVACIQFTWSSSSSYSTKGKVRLAASPKVISISASGSVLAGGTAWGNITGTLSNQSDLQAALDAKVPTTRTISTTAPLGGGGDLSANRTLTISAATTGAAGSMSAADKTKLDGIEALADVTDAGNVGSTIYGATAKTTLADADRLPLTDSAASNALKHITWDNFKKQIPFEFPFASYTAFLPLSATGVPYSTTIGKAFTATEFNAAFYVVTTNNSTNYWKIEVFDLSDTSALSFTTKDASESANAWYRKSVTSFSYTDMTTSRKGFYVVATKTGSPGSLYLLMPKFIGTYA